MVDQRGEEDRYGDYLGGEESLGNKVGVFYHAGGATQHGFLEEQPGEHSAEQEHGVVLGHRTGGERGFQADLEDEGPAQEQDQGVDHAPDPAGGGAYVALLEVAADELDYQRALRHQIAHEVAAGNMLHDKSVN